MSLSDTHDRASVVVRLRPFTILNVFSSERAQPITAKFYVDPPRKGGTKVYINGPGHMTLDPRGLSAPAPGLYTCI